MQAPNIFPTFTSVRETGRASMPLEECILDCAAPYRGLIEWCWAAVTVGVITAYRSGTTTQCLVAARCLPCEQCCQPLQEEEVECCNNPEELRTALAEHCGAYHGSENGPEDFIRRCIRDGLPIIARIAWSATSGHYVIIRGYRVMRTGFEVHVSDPDVKSIPPTPLPLSHLLTFYKQDGVWNASYETQPHPTLGVRRVPQRT